MGRGAGAIGKATPRRGVALAWALCLLLTPAVRAVDFGGSGSVIYTSTDNQAVETDLTQGQASFSLVQDFTPYTKVRLGYRYFKLDSESSLGNDFDRRSREPIVELLYNRPRVAARLTARQRKTDGSALSDNFKADSLAANLSWRPSLGPRFQAAFRDESNVADEAVFGRGTDSQFVSLEAFYDWRWGGASYGFRRNTLDNEVTGFESEQRRHDLRGYAFESFLDDRVGLEFSGSLSRVNRESETRNPDFTDPVLAAQGLFDVDTSPEIGTLSPAPALIDGDFETPAAPGIDIGGANRYRNVGLDLGVKQEVTRLEITVTTVSDRDLVWEVYSSPDNLFWQRVDGVASAFDGAFLRYTLFFPETTERYFKAVNVSTNSEPTVLVSEMRALLDVAVEARTEELDSTLYRMDLGADFLSGRRVSGRVDFGFSNDEAISEGLVRRDFDERHAGARLTARLKDDVRLDATYRYGDTKNRQPSQFRTEHTYGSNLTWTPLPTVHAGFSVQRRDEYAQSDLLQTDASARALVTLTVLPDLRLIADAALLRTDDRVADFDRRGWEWRETLSARPRPRWGLGATFAVSRLETPEGETVLDRTDYGVNTNWLATQYLALTGSWTLIDQNQRKDLRQTYSLSYNPGPKLSVSLAYDDFDTQNERQTSTGSLSINYRLNRHFTVFGSLSRSRSAVPGTETSEIESARIGLRFVI